MVNIIRVYMLAAEEFSDLRQSLPLHISRLAAQIGRQSHRSVGLKDRDIIKVNATQK